MHKLSPKSLLQWLNSDRPDPVLLDVREPWEFNICHLNGAILSPLASIMEKSTALDKATEIVVICHHGVRSQYAGYRLEQAGFIHIYNLEGGIAQWSAQIDAAMPTY